MGKISGMSWQSGGYVNPSIPPEVAQALAERGFNPDGSRMATADRLKGINDRISQDWAAMGFNPPPPEQDPNPRARMRVEQFTRGVDADYEARMAVADAILAGRPETARQRPAPGGGTTVAARPEMPATGFPAARAQPSKAPIPKARPRAESYTIRKGDSPEKIARMHGMSLKELEAKNPGILKRARRLKIGSKVRV